MNAGTQTLEIMQLIWNPTSSWKTAKSTLYPPKNRRNKTSSSKRTSEKGISDPWNHQWHHPSSLSPRRTQRNWDPAGHSVEFTTDVKVSWVSLFCWSINQYLHASIWTATGVCILHANMDRNWYSLCPWYEWSRGFQWSWALVSRRRPWDLRVKSERKLGMIA